jgi:hypothetical protein
VRSLRLVVRGFLALTVLAFLALLAASLGPSGVGCGTVVIHTRGRLTDPTTGAPVVNAVITGFRQARDATDPERIADAERDASEHERYALEAIAAGREPRKPGSYDWFSYPRARTDPEGRFDLYVTCGVSMSHLGLFGGHRSEPSPGDGIAVLRVRLPTSDEVRVVSIEGGRGTWRRTEATDRDDPWAEWELGDVGVPATGMGR